MKKILLLTTAVLMAFPAVSAFIDTVKTTTVRDIKTMKDDTPVQLEGNITKALGDDKYTFTDGTGSITVEIDDEDWKGVDVTPADKVRLDGEIDKDLLKTKVDVHSVQKIQNNQYKKTTDFSVVFFSWRMPLYQYY